MLLLRRDVEGAVTSSRYGNEDDSAACDNATACQTKTNDTSHRETTTN